MNYEKEINDKLIKVEILDTSTDILTKKQTFLHKNYKNRQHTSVINKLKSNKLNTYILVRIISDKRVVYRYEELYKVKDKSEWIEVLVLMFQELEEYEICKTLLELLKII